MYATKFADLIAEYNTDGFSFYRQSYQIIHPIDVYKRQVESYHSWSSNSRWFVFSSRRIDGLYTRPYIAYVDEDGKVGKPFLLPQKDAGFYQSFMKSFNIPEFITGKVKVRGRVLAIKAKEDKGTDVRLAQQ